MVQGVTDINTYSYNHMVQGVTDINTYSYNHMVQGVTDIIPVGTAQPVI